MKKKITIAIPAFKGLFLKECLDSVLAQDYSNYEILIVDDCSPDNLDCIVAQYKNDKIRYFRNDKNFGAEHVVHNWNKCLELATGDYIICMGDDDKLKSNCLSDLMELIIKYPHLDIYYSMTELIDEHSHVFRVLERREERESVYDMIWNRWNGGSMFIGNYCFKVDSLRERGGFYNLPFAWGSDAISAYEAALKNGIANTQEVGFQYRQNRHSISRHFDNIEGKVNAILLEKKWFAEFFRQIPTNSHDRAILEKLKEKYDDHFIHMLCADIIYGISHRPISQTKYWIVNRKKLGLPTWNLVKCFIHGIFGI